MAERIKNMRQLLIEAGIEEINRSGVTDFSVRRVLAVCAPSTYCVIAISIAFIT